MRAPSFCSTCFRPTGFRPQFFVQSYQVRLGLDKMDRTKTGWTKMNQMKSRSTKNFVSQKRHPHSSHCNRGKLTHSAIVLSKIVNNTYYFVSGITCRNTCASVSICQICGDYFGSVVFIAGASLGIYIYVYIYLRCIYLRGVFLSLLFSGDKQL